MLSFSKDLWLLSFHNQRTFQRTKTFTLSMRFCKSRDVSSSRKLPQTKSSFIKDVYHKQIFFLHEGSFPQTKIFFLEEVFLQKPRFLLHQGSFPQTNVFPSSRKFFTRKDFPSKKYSTSRYFSTSQGFSLINEVFLKQRLFCNHINFLDAKSFSSRKDLTSIQYLQYQKECQIITLSTKSCLLLSVLKKYIWS